MTEIVESADSTTVSVWTPWGEQKVKKFETRTAQLRRAASRFRASDELAAVPDFSERSWPAR